MTDPSIGKIINAILNQKRCYNDKAVLDKFLKHFDVETSSFTNAVQYGDAISNIKERELFRVTIE